MRRISALVLVLSAGCGNLMADLGGAPAGDGGASDAAAEGGADGSALESGPGSDTGSTVDATSTDGAADASDSAVTTDASAGDSGSPSGVLDTTFGGLGYVLHFGTAGAYLDAYDIGRGVAVDSQGRILVGGTTFLQWTYAAVWRITSDGAFDATFGNGGCWYENLQLGVGALPFSEGQGLLVDDQDRPVLVGAASNSPGYPNAFVATWRLTTDGTSDPTFGGVGGDGGPLSPYMGQGEYATRGAAGGNDEGFAVARDSQGNLVVGGSSNPGTGFVQTTTWRITPAAAADTSYGSPNGFVTVTGTAPGDGGARNTQSPNAVVIDHAGRAVLAGIAADDGNYAALWRFTPGGTVDTTFASVGHVTFQDIAQQPIPTPGASLDEAWGVTVDAQDDVIFCGETTGGPYGSSPDKTRAFVGRLTPAGALDPTFGTGGFVILDPPAGSTATRAHAVAIDAMGRLVVAGYASGGMSNYVTAWRMLPSGALDTSFGASGLFSRTQTAGPGLGDVALALTLDAQGRIILAGYSDGTLSPMQDRNMAVWRLTP